MPTLFGERQGLGGHSVLLLDPELRGAPGQRPELQRPLLVLGSTQPGQGAEMGPAVALGSEVWQRGVDQLVGPVGDQADPMNSLLNWGGDRGWQEGELAGESRHGGKGCLTPSTEWLWGRFMSTI